MMENLGPLVRVVKVSAQQPLVVRVEFEDGTRKSIDLERLMYGPIFEPIRSDPCLFAKVVVEGGTISWPNGADIDPDVLYYGLEPTWMTEPEFS